MKTFKISKLKQGPIRQEVLPAGFIVRVQEYKKNLEEVETSSLEDTISNFQRDLHPKSELFVWEKISEKYKSEIENNPDWTLKQKKELFFELLASSLSFVYVENKKQ